MTARSGPAGRASRLLWAVGAAVLGLVAADVAMTIATADLASTFDGAGTMLALAFAAVGLVVIRRQPRNPIGWLLTSSGVVILGVLDAALYAVLDYRDHAGALPLGQEAVVVESAAFATVVLCGLTVPLFPDGHLPSPRWRWALAIYIGAGAMFTVSQVIEQVAAVTAAPVRVDGSGSPLASGCVSGVAAAVVGVRQGGYLVVLGLWLIFIGRQVVGYVRSSGDRRQQLKWLFSGAAVSGRNLGHHPGGQLLLPRVGWRPGGVRAGNSRVPRGHRGRDLAVPAV